MKQNLVFKTMEESKESEIHSPIILSRNILDAARLESQRIISEAQLEAQKIIDQAKIQASQILEIDTSAKFIDAFQLRSDAFKQLKEEMYEAVLVICEEVLGLALKTQPESILNRIERALNKISHCNKVTLVINPVDMDLVKNRLTDLYSTQNHKIEIDLVPDPTITPGDASLQSSLGTVVSSVAGHLAAIHLHLTRK